MTEQQQRAVAVTTANGGTYTHIVEVNEHGEEMISHLHPDWRKEIAIAELNRRKASMNAIEYLMSRLQIEADANERDEIYGIADNVSDSDGSESEDESDRLPELLSTKLHRTRSVRTDSTMSLAYDGDEDEICNFNTSTSDEEMEKIRMRMKLGANRSRKLSGVEEILITVGDVEHA